MKDSDKKELIRLSKLEHANPHLEFKRKTANLNTIYNKFNGDRNRLNQIISDKLYFLAKGLQLYYFTNGALENNYSKIISGCHLSGRILLYHEYFNTKRNNYSEVYLWSLLYSILANDAQAIKSYYKVFPTPCKYKFNIRAIENGIRLLFEKKTSVDIENEIFHKKGSNLYFENAIQIIRDYLNKDDTKFKEHCSTLLRSYRRWAVANTMYAEISIPIAPMALIKFGMAHCEFKIPDLSSISRFAIQDFNQLLDEKPDKNQYQDFIQYWPELFKVIEELPLDIEIEDIGVVITEKPRKSSRIDFIKRLFKKN